MLRWGLALLFISAFALSAAAEDARKLIPLSAVAPVVVFRKSRRVTSDSLDMNASPKMRP